MPVREFEAKFTKSELFMVAWRSQELYAQTMSGVRSSSSGRTADNVDLGLEAHPTGRATNKQELAGLPDQFFNEVGELDLSKVTGAEAHHYLSAIGIHIPVVQPGEKPKGDG